MTATHPLRRQFSAQKARRLSEDGKGVRRQDGGALKAATAAGGNSAYKNACAQKNFLRARIKQKNMRTETVRIWCADFCGISLLPSDKKIISWRTEVRDAPF